MLGLGISLWLFAAGEVEGGGSSGPRAPILAWTSASSVATPTFSVDLDDSVAANDVLTTQYASDNLFTSPTTTIHTITAPEIAASQINLSIGALANGTYYVRAKIAHGSGVSAWSNTVVVTISVASNAPTYYILGF